jgi:ATP-dependent phosphoenolpyruvate carboxykinase
MTENQTPAPDLRQYGISDVEEIYYNPSYEFLFEQETLDDLEGYEKGTITECGAVAVDTGIFTGRSPKDKYRCCQSKTRTGFFSCLTLINKLGNMTKHYWQDFLC